MSSAPRFRQRGQQVNLTGMTLQQHLRDASRSAKITIDLERRMRIKQIRQGAFR